MLLILADEKSCDSYKYLKEFHTLYLELSTIPLKNISSSLAIKDKLLQLHEQSNESNKQIVNFSKKIQETSQHISTLLNDYNNICKSYSIAQESFQLLQKKKTKKFRSNTS